MMVTMSNQTEFFNSLHFEFFSQVANGENGTQQGAFYFTHMEMILPTILKLGLYRDEEPLTYYSFVTLKENRKWFVSLCPI